MASNTIFEFRGVDNLVYAPVLVDTESSFTTGTVKSLSPVAEIGRTTENSSESHYYDNKPMIVISSVGSDELKLTVAPLDLPTYAEITGQTYDAETGSLIEGERDNKYFAIGYRTKGTDGGYRYVWRYKGQFNIPDETNSTENDGTDTTNTELTWIGVQTVHKFNKYGKSAKAIVCDKRMDRVDFTTFFNEVKTPDNLVGTTAKVKNPIFYPTLETFSTDTLKISLVSETSGATISYTTDGSNPLNSETRTVYSTPFEISATTTIKAVAQSVSESMTISDIVTKTYSYVLATS